MESETGDLTRMTTKHRSDKMKSPITRPDAYLEKTRRALICRLPADAPLRKRCTFYGRLHGKYQELSSPSTSSGVSKRRSSTNTKPSYLKKAWTAEQLAGETIIDKEITDSLIAKRRKARKTGLTGKVLFKIKWPQAAKKIKKENVCIANSKNRSAVLDQDVALPGIEQRDTDVRKKKIGTAASEDQLVIEEQDAALLSIEQSDNDVRKEKISTATSEGQPLLLEQEVVLPSIEQPDIKARKEDVIIAPSEIQPVVHDEEIALLVIEELEEGEIAA